MPKRRTARVPLLNPGDPLLIQSLGRRARDSGLPRLSAEQVARVARTVARVPEVVVKVSGGGPDAGSVGAHLRYISRRGALPLELDSGETLSGSGVQKRVVKDWSLDALPKVTRSRLGATDASSNRAPVRSRPKAVHNIVLSMPAAVPPEKVLAAARVFARENFALMHRYAMVLHTDTRHPHVHLVVKAEREDGTGRLNIYKATLRQWREQFAQALRDQGIEANATPAALRGWHGRRLKPAIDRAHRRGAGSDSGAEGSTFLRRKVVAVLKRLANEGAATLVEGRATLDRTRAAVDAQWERTARALDAQGDFALAMSVRAFAASLPAVTTDAQRIAAAATRLREERAGREAAQGSVQSAGRGR
jgi:hypothetical protein